VDNEADPAAKCLHERGKCAGFPVSEAMTPARTPCYGVSVGGNRDDKAADAEGTEPVLSEADAHGYRRRLSGFSTNVRPHSANDAAAEGFSVRPALTVGMDRMITEVDPRRLPDLGYHPVHADC